MKQEVAHLGIKSIILELGLFRTKIMGPENFKSQSNPIADYDEIREAIAQFVQSIDGNQPGDTKKAVEIIFTVVRGEGVAEGRSFPERLPLGPDSLTSLRVKAVGDLAICNEWEDVIRSTERD